MGLCSLLPDHFETISQAEEAEGSPLWSAIFAAGFRKLVHHHLFRKIHLEYKLRGKTLPSKGIGAGQN